MAISNSELGQILMMGIGNIPIPISSAATAKTGIIAQTMPVTSITTTGSYPGGSSGVMHLTPLYICANQTITNISCLSGTVAASVQTNLWCALYDDGRGSTNINQFALLRQTNNLLTANPSTNSIFTLTLLAPYTTTYSGIYYVGVMSSATTPISMQTSSKSSTIGIYMANSVISYSSITTGSGLTTTAPNPSGSPIPGIASLYCFLT